MPSQQIALKCNFTISGLCLSPGCYQANNWWESLPTRDISRNKTQTLLQAARRHILFIKLFHSINTTSSKTVWGLIASREELSTGRFLSDMRTGTQARICRGVRYNARCTGMCTGQASRRVLEGEKEMIVWFVHHIALLPCKQERVTEKCVVESADKNGQWTVSCRGYNLKYFQN